jgi:hypothetical protein
LRELSGQTLGTIASCKSAAWSLERMYTLGVWVGFSDRGSRSCLRALGGKSMALGFLPRRIVKGRMKMREEGYL